MSEPTSEPEFRFYCVHCGEKIIELTKTSCPNCDKSLWVRGGTRVENIKQKENA